MIFNNLNAVLFFTYTSIATALCTSLGKRLSWQCSVFIICMHFKVSDSEILFVSIVLNDFKQTVFD